MVEKLIDETVVNHVEPNFVKIILKNIYSLNLERDLE